MSGDNPATGDGVTALIERLHSHARHATVLGNAQSTQDEYLAEWLYRFADEGHEAAEALKRLAAETVQIKADRNRLVEEWAKDGRVLDRALAAEAERDALPEKIAQAIEALTHWSEDYRAGLNKAALVARSFGATPGERECGYCRQRIVFQDSHWRTPDRDHHCFSHLIPGVHVPAAATPGEDR